MQQSGVSTCVSGFITVFDSNKGGAHPSEKFHLALLNLNILLDLDDVRLPRWRDNRTGTYHLVTPYTSIPEQGDGCCSGVVLMQVLTQHCMGKGC